MKVLINGFITSKCAEEYIDCADNYAINADSHRFAISDGVSKSFFPKIWSEILVRQFVKQTEIKDIGFINLCQSEWQKTIDGIVSLPNTKWFTRSQYNRKDPALATFVGLEFFEKEKKWSASAIGDSFLFFVPKGFTNYDKELVKLSSKSEPIIFDNFPDYLTSIGDSHKGMPMKESGGILKDGIFYLMTDALAEWFINEGVDAIEKIKIWKNQSEFERSIKQARESGKLTNDDSAILIIEISESVKKGINYTKRNLTSLKDLISEQDIEKTNVQLKKEEERKKLDSELDPPKVNDFEIVQDNASVSEKTGFPNKSKNSTKAKKRCLIKPKFKIKFKKVTRYIKNKVAAKSKVKKLHENSAKVNESSSHILNIGEKETVNEEENSLNDIKSPPEEKDGLLEETENNIENLKEENLKEEVVDTKHTDLPKFDPKTKNIFDKF
jgi:hypothetical protein